MTVNGESLDTCISTLLREDCDITKTCVPHPVVSYKAVKDLGVLGISITHPIQMTITSMG